MPDYYKEYIKYKNLYQDYKRMVDYIDCQNLFIKKITDKERKERKTKVYNHLLKNVIRDKNFDKLTATQLEKTYMILDKVYFNGKIGEYLYDNCNMALNFKTSGRLKSTAGMCKYKYKYKGGKIKYYYTIEISSPIVYSMFNKGEKSLKINGLSCKNRLECYINLFEHELTHLIIFLFCPEMGEGMGGHTRVFRDIVHNLFGHTEYKHYLLEGDLEEMEKRIEETKINVEIGDYITSKKIGAKIYKGTVVKVNPKGVTIESDNGKKWRIYFHAIDKINKGKGKKKVFKKEQDIEALKKRLAVGDKIHAKIRKKIQKGEILALNPSRAKVRMEDDKIWYIPYNLILL
jgi:hypothetical protein